MKYEPGTRVKPSWTGKHVYGHVKKAAANKKKWHYNLKIKQQ